MLYEIIAHSLYLLLHDSGEFLEICYLIEYFLTINVHEVTEEKATYVVIMHLAIHGQVTQYFVYAHFKVVLCDITHDAEEFLSEIHVSTVVSKAGKSNLTASTVSITAQEKAKVRQ